jgi:HK97 family phage prohead protease
LKQFGDDEQVKKHQFVLSSESSTRAIDRDSGNWIEERLLLIGLKKIPETVSLFDTHERSSILGCLGSVRDLQIVGKVLVGNMYYSSTPSGQEAYSLVEEGHITDCSVGFKVFESILIPAGDIHIHYDVQYPGPMKLITSWELIEVSLCHIGANPDCKIIRAPKNAVVAETEK